MHLRRPIPYRLLGLLAAGLLALLLAGCGSVSCPSTQPLKGSFVGALPGTSAFLAVTTSDGKADAYACDSQTLVGWFVGEVHNGSFAATAKDGAELQATIAHSGAEGTLPPPRGQPLPFHLAPAMGKAGLYVDQETLNGTAHLDGWDVLATGDQRGAVKTKGKGGNTIIAMPLLDTTTGSTSVPGVGTLHPQHADGFINPNVGL